MSEDMSNMMNQISDMIKNNQIPEDVKNMISQLNTSSESTNHSDSDTDSNTSKDDTSSNSSNPFSGFDIGTMMKMKQIMDSMNTGKNDPRSNLLLSLKPYLKESRKSKIDQYIQIFNMEKVFEMLNPLGGENKK